MEELHLTVSIPEEMGWNRLFHPQLKKRLSFVYRPRLIFLWALGTVVISGSKVLQYYDDFAAGRATVLVKFQQRYEKSHRIFRNLLASVHRSGRISVGCA